MNAASQEKERPCEVCKAPARCIGFASYICKACSVFYRRTYKQLNILKCNRGEKCTINHDSRNICRKCRLIKCREAGLRMVGKNLIVQLHGHPENDIDEIESPQSESSNEENCCQKEEDIYVYDQTTLNNVSNELTNYPLLNYIVDAYRQFEQRQRFISAVHQDKELVDDEPALVSKNVFSLVENATIRLSCVFAAEILNKCNLTIDQKLSTLKALAIQVSMAQKMILTTRFFPQLHDSRVSLFIGLYYDVENLQAFLGHEYPFKIDMVRPMFVEGQRAADKIRRIQPSFVESVIFMAIVVIEELERQNIDSCDEFCQQLYSEFTDYLTKLHKSSKIATYRLIRLSSLLYEVKTLTVIQEQMHLVLDVFLPDNLKSIFEVPPKMTSNELEHLATAANDYVERISKMNFQ